MKAVLGQLTFLTSIGEYICFVISSFATTFRRLPRWSLIREQLYSAGVLSLSVVSLTGFSTGLVLATQSYYQLYNKGLVGLTGLLVAKAMLTELGPVLTAFMFVGRVGSAVTAELATMKVTEQVDAMVCMAVDPQRHLVSPRLLSGILMLPLLTVYSVVLGVFGGYLIAVYFFGLAPTTFWDPIPLYVEPFDFWIGFIKSVVFGVLGTTICCYMGMMTTGGAKDVGDSTTKAVVLCYVAILILNFLLTLALNILRNEIKWWFS